ncbi:MAG: DUF4190 domain-containing protein [Gemmataceae bacterium]
MSGERPADDNIRRDPPLPPDRRAENRPYKDEDEDAYYRRIRRSIRDEPQEVVAATDFIVPVNVNPWALAASYLGLIGFCLPLLGIPFALLAIVFAILALRSRPSSGSTTYSKVTGNIRAWIGLVLGIFGLILWPMVFLVFLIAELSRR